MAALLLSCKALAAPAVSLSAVQQKVLSAPLQKPYLWFASTDPEHQNNDFLLLKPGETRTIALAKGQLLRIWSTALEPDKITLSLKDDTTISLLKNNKASIGTLYKKAYTLYPQDTGNAKIQQLGKTASLVVTNGSKEENKFFYQVTIRPLPIPKAPQYRGKEVLINAQKTLDAGEALLVGDPGQLRGGVIREVRISSTNQQKLPLGDLLLQMATEDGTVLVQIPLSAFLGAADHLMTGKSGLSTWDGKTLLIHWPMSTGSDTLSFKLQNVGESPASIKVQLSFLEMNDPPPYLFFARQGSANSVKDQPFTLATISGAGALVGLTANMGPQPESPRRTFAFLEGNEIINADGQEYEGTGTEDFFNSSWYFPKQPYLRKYDGMTAHSDLPPRVMAYRWMIDDAVPFTKELKITLEHGNGNSGSGLEYHWNVFCYLQQPLQYDIPVMISNSNAAEQETTAPVNSLVYGLLRVLIFTLFFAGFIFIVLVALAKYGQKKS